MPPAAVMNDYQSHYPLCCGAFDIGEIEIEVQALESDERSMKSTQIVVSPGSNNGFHGSGHGKPSQLPLNDYLSTLRGSPNTLDRLGGDSFDSTDEIVEGSNEMKLMRRVVNKQRANSNNANHGGIGGDQNSGLQRQDSMSSMSDTNSVNGNDVFVSVDSKDIEYLDVLDQHLNQTNPDALDYSHLEAETEDFHPNRQKYQANLDDIIEHLCAAPCGACLPDVDDMIDNRRGGFPKSVLRKPRYSTPDRSSVYRSTNNNNNTSKVGGIHAQPILIRSSSSYNPTARTRNNNIQEQHSVQFQNVDIRNFKMTLGNHPSATTGPPVMLDGELIEPHHLARKIMTLDKYEKTRPPRRKRRQLKLTLQQRHNILVKERGFTFEEVKGAWQESLSIRRQRKETLDRGLAMMKWDEVWESTCRKFSRLVDVIP
jgi:hypothetical protein